MGNINGVPGQFGAIIDSHFSRSEYFIQMVKVLYKF